MTAHNQNCGKYNHRLIFFKLGVASIALSLMLLARPVSSPAAESDSAMEALVAAAKQEGEVVVYDSESDKQIADTAEAFAKKYGIKTQATRLSSGTITSRYSGERQGNTVVADVVVISNDPFIEENPSWWVPINETVVPGYDKFPAAEKGSLWLTLNRIVIGIAWNTNLVKGDDVPKGYQDLLTNPAFAKKGSIVIADPRSTPSVMNYYKVLVENLGEGYFKKLMDRGVVIAAAPSPGVQQVAAGGSKVLIGNFANQAQSIIAAGAPVKYVPITNPATGSDNRIALSTSAKHPNAARLYAAWRISEEGQRVMCLAKGGSSPLGDLPGCEPATPANFIKPDYKVYQDREWQAKYLPLLGLKPL